MNEHQAWEKLYGMRYSIVPHYRYDKSYSRDELFEYRIKVETSKEEV